MRNKTNKTGIKEVMMPVAGVDQYVFMFLIVRRFITDTPTNPKATPTITGGITIAT